MLRTLRLTLPIIAAILASGLDAAAQTSSTVDVQLTLSVPFTFRNLHPEITALSADCRVSMDSAQTEIVGFGITQPVAVSKFTKSTDGVVAGTIALDVPVKPPAGAGGRRGFYDCRLKGSAPGGPGPRAFEPQSMDRRFAVVGAYNVRGSFVW